MLAQKQKLNSCELKAVLKIILQCTTIPRYLTPDMMRNQLGQTAEALSSEEEKNIVVVKNQGKTR